MKGSSKYIVDNTVTINYIIIKSIGNLEVNQ